MAGIDRSYNQSDKAPSFWYSNYVTAISLCLLQNVNVTVVAIDGEDTMNPGALIGHYY